MSAFEILGQVLIAAGALTFFTAGLGVLRFPDVYTRASAVATASGLGVALIVFGAVFMQPGVTDAIKAVLVVVLQLITAAIGSMTMARAAYLTGVKLQRRSFDELDETGQQNNEG